MGILTHAAYSALDHQHYGGDTRSYLIPADNLLHGQGFVNAGHQPELFRTPGYPFLLAIFRFAPLRVEYLIFVQHVLCVFLIVGVAVFAQRSTGSDLVAFVAALVLSLDMATLRMANLLLTEITFTVLIALSAWAIYRTMTKPADNILASAVAGFLGGCAVLVRPVGILYFVPLSICLVWALKRRALRPVLIFVLSFLLLPLVWATRNFVEAGYFGVSTVGAQDILYDQAVGTLAIQRPGDYPANVLKVRGELTDQMCSDLERAYKRKCSQVTESQKAAYSMRKGMSIILRNPVSRFRSVLQALAYIIFGGGAEALSRISDTSPRIAQYIVLLFTVPYACLALVGCWYWYRRDRNLCYVLVLSIVYFLVISALGVQADSRLRVPVMPMYALLIGGGTAGIVQLIQRTRTSRMASAHPIAPQS
ncbi:MAG TPA: glycosyltransferase family 39 protein [Pseudacidobacterium sp.]|nr:glycosyltransferase family 39 protein [Pseudacidobacterium sp.]